MPETIVLKIGGEILGTPDLLDNAINYITEVKKKNPKLSLVLVDGSKNSVARVLPFSKQDLFCFSNFFAVLSMCKISALEKSFMDIISLFLKPCMLKK